MEALAALEAAASLLLAPPNMVTKEQLKEAEAIILDFRKIRAPYQLCKQILETSSNEYVLFEAIGLINIALINEWSSLNPDDVNMLKNYMYQYLISRQIPASLREKIVKVLSVIVKYQSIEDNGASRHGLVHEAKTLIQAGAASATLGCSLLNAILQEHTLNSRTDPLPSDKRQLIKRQFECTDLLDISSFTIRMLEEIVDKRAVADQTDIVLAEKLLQLMKAALCWGQLTLILPALLVDSDMKDQSQAWTTLITNEKFFNTLGLMGRHGEPLLSPVLSCLEQLTYVIVGCSETDKENALRLARALIPLLGVAPSPAPATALRRLVINFTRHLLSLSPADLLQFITTLLAYIEHLIRLSALEEAHAATGTDEEDGWRMGLEAALEAWVELLHVAAPQLLTSRPPKPVPPAFVEGSAHIFDALLKTRLGAPDGTRHAGAENEAEIEEEGCDIERYDNLLLLAGALGRAAPDHTLPLLCRLLESRVSRMQELFGLGHGSPELCCIYEDIHWTILFAAHVLTQDGEGEIPAIPGELVRYSTRVPGDLNSSLRLLASPENPPSETDLNNANHTVRLIAGVWRMCSIAGWGVGQWVASPTLGASVTWFLRRWARAYWLPDEGCAVVSGKPGPVLQAVWCRGSPADVWATQRLATGALALLRSLPGDPTPSQHAVALLRTIATIDCREGGTGITHIWEAVKWGIGSEGTGLSEEIRRGLAASAGAAISALPETQQSTHLAALLAPANMALTKTSDTPSFLQALDIFTGLAEGCQTKSANCIWEQLNPAFVASIVALRTGELVTRSTLRLAAAAVARLPQSILNQAGGILLLRIIELLRSYAARPILQFNNAAQAADAEDDYCEETSLIMEIVSELVTKGYDDSMEKGNKEGMAAVMEGIRVIFPRMVPPTPLLQRPTISKRYYRLLFDFGPDIICSLEDQYFNIVMQSIADGLEAPSDDDSQFMCKLLGNLGRQASTSRVGGGRLLEALPTLANRLLAASATGTLQSHLGLAASTYYSLVCNNSHIQVPPELTAMIKAHSQTSQSQNVKPVFVRFFSHLNSYNFG